jgi:hypothetical protein
MNADARDAATARATAPLIASGLTHRYEGKPVPDHVDLALEPVVLLARHFEYAWLRANTSLLWTWLWVLIAPPRRHYARRTATIQSAWQSGLELLAPLPNPVPSPRAHQALLTAYRARHARARTVRGQLRARRPRDHRTCPE